MDFIANDFLTPTLCVLLIIVAGFTSFVTAGFGAGGGLFLLVVMAAIMPMSAVIPVHGLVQLGSNANRAILTYRHLDRKMLLYFSLGAVIGAFSASFVVTQLPLTLMKLLLGVFVIYLLWATTPTIKETSTLGRIIAGIVTTFLSMFVGASGPLVGSYMYMNNYDKLRFTATFSTCMTFQHCLKALVFGAIGFAFWDWLPLIIAMVLSGTIGTWLGIKLLKRLPAERFKFIFKIVLTLMSVQLIWQAGMSILQDL
ncbi:sulfite exporter TauE/SafE family protein [Aliiglaciecola sp. 2_MG-2023]|uniref:sulfite exporter TauE/SafE family protein n=1 Tax=unclassified Aliiglaciecola TaxID=2593648 RepID=UPI0026E41A4D|nr:MULTISPECIES: sulfite exporter TauE/SafE family protein [unclassified Aliiglaciecola]MDO6710175.1 sulfite exporter TauE/SafE family protein [Aliiglaciecola sp. 2_MG-2023]MDO6751323.1 sulfite exporter TauE/SafE family protein [Aliiglaciecola sp. 1_MG-2023]